MAEQGDPAAQWDDGYALGDTSRSWFQREPALSLRMLDAAGVSAADGLIDVGGGASTLADALLARGFSDVTVLDVSATGMQYGASAPRGAGAPPPRAPRGRGGGGAGGRGGPGPPHPTGRGGGGGEHRP
ncbi:MAG: hypothetical protein ACHP9Z_04330, partial [Streptosporangiales bacterium]